MLLTTKYLKSRFQKSSFYAFTLVFLRDQAWPRLVLVEEAFAKALWIFLIVESWDLSRWKNPKNQS
jgi:hypothetical protein